MAYKPGTKQYQKMKSATGTKTSPTAKATRTARGPGKPPAIPKPYLVPPKAKAPSGPKLAKARALGGKVTKAFKATKGTSSKRAVRRTTKKIMARSGRSKASARSKARVMVRFRKMK